jgi:hypothetical protein
MSWAWGRRSRICRPWIRRCLEGWVECSEWESPEHSLPCSTSSSGRVYLTASGSWVMSLRPLHHHLASSGDAGSQLDISFLSFISSFSRSDDTTPTTVESGETGSHHFCTFSLSSTTVLPPFTKHNYNTTKIRICVRLGTQHGVHQYISQHYHTICRQYASPCTSARRGPMPATQLIIKHTYMTRARRDGGCLSDGFVGEPGRDRSAGWDTKASWASGV